MPNSIGKYTAVLAEMVDVFPTLAALAGLPDPRTVAGSIGINGTSLAPVRNAIPPALRQLGVPGVDKECRPINSRKGAAAPHRRPFRIGNKLAHVC